MITCPHCGAVTMSTVYSTCYRCEKKIKPAGNIRPPEGMQANGRTVIPDTDRRLYAENP